jgi:phosphoglycolate phosphatase
MSCIALDLDGTIEDSRADMVRAINRTRAQLGGAGRPDELLRPHVSKGMTHLYLSCFDDLLGGARPGDARFEDVKRAYEADYLAHIADETKLYAGIADALAALAELGALCCVTNKPERHSRALLDALGVGARFAEVIGGDTCPEEKPSAVPLLEAARRCDASPPAGRVFLIGDSAGDVRCGRAAGATTIWCAWGYYDDTGDDAPHHVARHPIELASIVRGALRA